MTRTQIDNRLEEASLRRENASQEAVIRRIEPRMQRAQHQHVRQTYLSEMARKRAVHEESKVQEYQQNIRQIRDREASLQSQIAEVDENSEHESLQESTKGLEQLAQMNGELEQLIRNVYAKMQAEREASS